MTDTTFLAEIRRVASKKLITNDIEYSLLLTTTDQKVIDLAKLPAETILEVSIKSHGRE